jgi:CHAT domain-containing protein
MSSREIQESRTRQYLLGELDGEEREQFEQQLLTQDEAVEQLNAIEDELVDDYLAGILKGDELAMFERHFLSSEDRTRKVRFAKAFRKYAADHRTATISPQSPVAPSRNWWQFLTSSPLTGVAIAVVIIVVAVAAWRVFFYKSDVDNGLVALNSAYKQQRPVEARITNLDYAPFVTLRGGDSARVDSRELERSERYLLDAVRDHPDALSHQALGKFYLTKRDFDKAISEFEEALKANPNNAQIYADLGAALLEKAKLDLSANRGNENTPEMGKGLEELARSLENLNKALEINPNLLEALFNRGLCYQYMKLPRQAAADWRKYLEKDSTSSWADEARRNLKALEQTSTTASSDNKAALSDFLAAYADHDDENAWKYISLNREDLHQSGIAEQLLNKYLDASVNGRRDETETTLSALAYLGQLEERRADEHFSGELARLCQRSTPAKIVLVKQGRDLMNSGHAYYSTSTYEKAIAAYENARRTFLQAGYHPAELQAQYWVGVCKLESGETVASLDLLKALAQECETYKYKWLLMRALNLISSAHFNLNNYTEAIDYCNLSLNVAKDLGDDIGAFNALDLLTEYYRTIDNYPHALSCIEQTFPLVDRCHFNAIQVWRHYAIVASALTAAGLYAAALSYQDEAVQRAVALGETSMACVSYVHLGLIYGKLRNFAEGIRNAQMGYDRAAKRSDEVTGKQMMAYSSLGIGHLFREAAKYDQAIANYNKSIQLYNDLEFPTLLYQAHKGRLACFISQGDYSSAREELNVTLDLIEKSRAKILESDERNSFFSGEQSVYDLAIDFAFSTLHDSEKAFSYSEQSRARSLLDLMNTESQVVMRNGSPSLRFSSVYRPLDLKTIQQRLPDQTQVIQYAALDEKLVIWVFDKNRVQVAESKINQNDLSEKVREYLALVTQPPNSSNTEATTLARELFDILIKPVSGLLDKDKKLCIVSDKILNELPFGALLSSAANKYLIEDHAITYSPSSSVFVLCSAIAAEKSPTNAERLLSVGDPSFDQHEFKALATLPAATNEAKIVASFYNPARILLGPSATKTTVTMEMKDADVVHFALHSIPHEREPMRSSLVLASESSSANSEPTESSTLQAYEIYELKLPKTKLVVLSACQTGFDRYYSGEGILSIARAFIVSGVPIVVASLWPVDSDGAAELMTAFHQNRKQRHLSTAEALRQAQLQLIRSPERFREPYYWAAFFAVGGDTQF